MNEQVRPFEKVITIRVNMRLLGRVVAVLCAAVASGFVLWGAYRMGRLDGFEQGYSVARGTFCTWCDKK